MVWRLTPTICASRDMVTDDHPVRVVRSTAASTILRRSGLAGSGSIAALALAAVMSVMGVIVDSPATAATGRGVRVHRPQRGGASRSTCRRDPAGVVRRPPGY